METRDVAIDRLKDRIEVLENALRDIRRIPYLKYENSVSPVYFEIQEIATKALWPV